mgnify:CR=1 FL=1
MGRSALAGLADIGQLLPSQNELKQYGMAGLGGAAGLTGVSLLLPAVSRLPLINVLPPKAIQAVLGVLAASAARKWWDADVAKGIAGAVIGHAVAGFALQFFNQPLALAGLNGFAGEAITAVPGAPGDEELEVGMEDIDPVQQFMGMGDPSVEDVQQLAGTYLT